MVTLDFQVLEVVPEENVSPIMLNLCVRLRSLQVSGRFQNDSKVCSNKSFTEQIFLYSTV